MNRPKLMKVTYYDPKNNIRLTGYSDTVVWDDKGKPVLTALRFGGYPEEVRGLADAIANFFNHSFRSGSGLRRYGAVVVDNGGQVVVHGAKADHICQNCNEAHPGHTGTPADQIPTSRPDHKLSSGHNNNGQHQSSSNRINIAAEHINIGGDAGRNNANLLLVFLVLGSLQLNAAGKTKHLSLIFRTTSTKLRKRKDCGDVPAAKGCTPICKVINRSNPGIVPGIAAIEHGDATPVVKHNVPMQ